MCDNNPEPPNKSTNTVFSGYCLRTLMNSRANMRFCPTNGSGADKYCFLMPYTFSSNLTFSFPSSNWRVWLMLFS